MKIPLFKVSAGRIVLCSLLVFSSCGTDEAPKQAPLEVQVIPVQQSDVELEAVFTGEVFGDADVEINPRVNGLIESMNFREGSMIQAGQLLYTIDRLPFQNKVEIARGALAEAQTHLAKSKSDLDMIEPLAKINAVSQRELVFVKAQYEAAKGKLQAAEASLRNAEIELGYCDVVAPISGLIGISKVRVGDYVSPGPRSTLNTISALSRMRVRFTVSEQEFMRVTKAVKHDSSQKLKNKAREIKLILSNGETYPYPGQINFADRQIDPTTGAITIEALFENPDNTLRPGQYARVAMVTELRQKALLIPQRCVNEMQGMFQVYTVGDSSKVKVKVIQAGPVYKDAYVVDDGLSAGEQVIMGGTKLLRPGMPVVVKTGSWSPGMEKSSSH